MAELRVNMDLVQEENNQLKKLPDDMNYMIKKLNNIRNVTPQNVLEKRDLYCRLNNVSNSLKSTQTGLYNIYNTTNFAMNEYREADKKANPPESVLEDFLSNIAFIGPSILFLHGALDILINGKKGDDKRVSELFNMGIDSLSEIFKGKATAKAAENFMNTLVNQKIKRPVGRPPTVNWVKQLQYSGKIMKKQVLGEVESLFGKPLKKPTHTTTKTTTSLGKPRAPAKPVKSVAKGSGWFKAGTVLSLVSNGLFYNEKYENGVENRELKIGTATVVKTGLDVLLGAAVAGLVGGAAVALGAVIPVGIPLLIITAGVTTGINFIAKKASGTDKDLTELITDGIMGGIDKFGNFIKNKKNEITGGNDKIATIPTKPPQPTWKHTSTTAY